jgi:thioredoxin 1
MSTNQEMTPAVGVGLTNFGSEVLQSKQPVLVAFWAPWSRPCQILEATIDEVAAACFDTVKVVKVNADDNPELSLLYDVQFIPTLLCFVGGILRARLVGTSTMEAILSKLQAVSRDLGPAPASALQGP